MRGHTAPRCKVTNSTFPAAVTAASSATASPPRPEEALGGPPGKPSMPTPTADGQTCSKLTIFSDKKAILLVACRAQAQKNFFRGP